MCDCSKPTWPPMAHHLWSGEAEMKGIHRTSNEGPRSQPRKNLLLNIHKDVETPPFADHFPNKNHGFPMDFQICLDHYPRVSCFSSGRWNPWFFVVFFIGWSPHPTKKKPTDMQQDIFPEVIGSNMIQPLAQLWTNLPNLPSSKRPHNWKITMFNEKLTISMAIFSMSQTVSHYQRVPIKQTPMLSFWLPKSPQTVLLDQPWIRRNSRFVKVNFSSS